MRDFVSFTNDVVCNNKKNLEECFRGLNSSSHTEYYYCKNESFGDRYVPAIYKDILEMMDCTNEKICSLDHYKQNHKKVHENAYYNAAIIARNILRSMMAEYMNIADRKDNDIRRVIMGSHLPYVEMFSLSKNCVSYEVVDAKTGIFIESGKHTHELVKPENNGRERFSLPMSYYINLPYAEKYKCHNMTDNVEKNKCFNIAREIEKLVDRKLPLPDKHKRILYKDEEITVRTYKVMEELNIIN